MQDVAVAASQSCRDDLCNAVQGLKHEDIVTNDNPTHGHCVTLLMPLTLPDRLPLISYLAEYFCLHDDEGDLVMEMAVERKRARKQLLVQLLGRFMAVNIIQTQSLIQGLEAYSATTALADRQRSFNTIEEYIDYRFHDYASEFMLAAMMFGMDMATMTDEERTTMVTFVCLGFRVISLINDYYSFDVEYACEEPAKKNDIINGVAVLMKLDGLSVHEAKQKLKDIAISFDRDFIALWEDMSARGCLAGRTPQLVEAIAFHMVGKAVWSSTTLRYDLAYRLKTQRTRADSVVEHKASANRETTTDVRATVPVIINLAAESVVTSEQPLRVR